VVRNSGAAKVTREIPRQPLKLKAIERAFHARAALAQHVGVDHGGGDIVMPEQFLDGADICAALQRVSREAVAKRVAGNAFDDAGPCDGSFDGPVDRQLVDMVAPHLSRTGVDRESGGGKDVLPTPFVMTSAFLDLTFSLLDRE